MPAGYEKIKANIKKEHPKWSTDRVKGVAAKIWNKEKKGTGETVGRGRK